MGLFSRKISDKQLNAVNDLLKECSVHSNSANNAVKPEVFFENYNALERKLKELTKYEKYGIFKGGSPSGDLARVKRQRINETNAMIERSFFHAKKKAAKAGESLTGNIVREYFKHMETFENEFDAFNKKVLADLKELCFNPKDG